VIWWVSEDSGSILSGRIATAGATVNVVAVPELVPGIPAENVVQVDVTVGGRVARVYLDREDIEPV
jgi:hypothetical protein